MASSATTVTTVQLPLDLIVEKLKDSNVRKLIVTGEPRTGKTWVARQISDNVVEKGLFNGALWFYLNDKYTDRSLLFSIASQLSLVSASEVVLDEEKVLADEELDGEEEEEEEEQERRVHEEAGTTQEEEHESSLFQIGGDVVGLGDDYGKKQMDKSLVMDRQKEDEHYRYLKRKVSARLDGKKFLVVLDDEGNMMNEEEITYQLNTFTHNLDDIFPKMLITRCSNRGHDHVTRELIEVKRLSLDESSYLFNERTKRANAVYPKLREHVEVIVQKASGLPAPIVMIAEALECIAREGHERWTVERAVHRVTRETRSTDSIRDLYVCGYDLLQDNVMTNCCWYSRQLFLARGSVHYNELIMYWMMEGYFGVIDSTLVAYRRGYNTLMQLIKRGMLIAEIDNFVNMEKEALEVIDDHGQCIFRASSLGLPNIFSKDEWPGIECVSLADGTMKGLSNIQTRRVLSAILVDGNRLCREVAEDFFQHIHTVQVLFLTRPAFESLPSSLYEMTALRVLVLRGCEQLCHVKYLSKLQLLEVLEISGASLLNELPDDLFDRLEKLRCLNLSESGIQSLPSPPENPCELQWLILRRCPNLEKLPSLHKFIKLEVLDLVGSVSFKRVKDKNFKYLKKLELVDFSSTQIESFPIISNLGELRRLFFRDCSSLKRLPRLPQSVHTLDLSGCSQLRELSDESLEDKNALKNVDVSATPLTALPPMPSCVSYLSLSGHLCIKTLTCKMVPAMLEVLDLSGVCNLDAIDEKTFQNLEYLGVLNLSKTKITSLPSISKLSNLHQLLLSGCQQLLVLPKMDTLENLEVLDLSGCTALREVQREHMQKFPHLKQLNLSGLLKVQKLDPELFDQITSLESLDLSNTPITELPSVASLKNLHRLSLKGCACLNELPTLGPLAKLEILDLSGTNLRSLPPMFFSLLTSLEVLDLSGTRIQEYPSEISGLTCLKRLHLPEIDNIDFDQTKYLPAELAFDGLGTFRLVSRGVNSTEPSTSANVSDVTFAVGSIKQNVKDEIVNLYQEPFNKVFRALRYSIENRLHHQPLEIHGFNGFVAGSDSFLRSGEYLSLRDASSISSLSDLGDIVANIKGCWLDRCNDTKSILQEKEKGIVHEDKLQVLWVSNLPRLESMCTENMPYKCFRNLTHLTLDCCPSIVSLFFWPHMPENIQVIEIKFCDKLETLFRGTESSQCRLDKLEKLRLFELPELKSIGAKLPPQLDLEVTACPNLEACPVDENIESAERTRSSI